jgi:hypothetical protein
MNVLATFVTIFLGRADMQPGFSGLIFLLVALWLIRSALLMNAFRVILKQRKLSPRLAWLVFVPAGVIYVARVAGSAFGPITNPPPNWPYPSGRQNSSAVRESD